MAVNRYSDIELSSYTPRSLQETLMVPMMRRQQHDDANKQLQNQILDLNKINPLDKHYSEAQRIKSELTGSINDQAQRLSTEGFNNNTTGDVFKTNRLISDAYSPTGAIGQMNSAKLAYEKDSDEYLKSATALGHSPEVVQRNLKAIQDEYNASPIYDKTGKINAMSINKLPPKYIDHVARFKDIADKAGLTSSDIENLSSSIQRDGTGGTYVLTQGGKRAGSSNTAALQAAVNFLNTEILNPNSDVGKSLKYGFKTPEEALQDIQNLAPVFKKSSTASSSSSQISNYNPAAVNTSPTGGADGSSFGEDYNTTEIGGSKNDYSELSRIGATSDQYVTSATSNFPRITGDKKTNIKEVKQKPFTVESIKDPKLKAIYNNAWEQATSGKGIVLDGKLSHLSKDYQKLGKNDPRVREQLLRSLKQSKPITLTSKLLTPNQILNDKGYVAGLGSTADDVDKNIRRQLQRNDQSGRKLIDPETGKVISWNEAAKEYGFENINDVNYQGQISAHNWEENENIGSNSKFSPHVVTVKDKNGEWHSFKTTRLNSDNIGGNPARQNDLTKNYRKATLAAANSNSDFQDFESNSKSLNGIKVKYNPSETETSPTTGEPKLWSVRFKDGRVQKATESEYMNFINSVK